MGERESEGEKERERERERIFKCNHSTNSTASWQDIDCKDAPEGTKNGILSPGCLNMTIDIVWACKSHTCIGPSVHEKPHWRPERKVLLLGTMTGSIPSGSGLARGSPEKRLTENERTGRLRLGFMRHVFRHLPHMTAWPRVREHRYRSSPREPAVSINQVGQILLIAMDPEVSSLCNFPACFTYYSYNLEWIKV